MSEEEVACLEEQLAEARAEADRLQLVAADREARAAQLTETVESLKLQLAESQQLAATQAGEIAALQESLALRQTEVRDSAARYRSALLATSPEVPSELVTGETVEEVERSLAQARETVARIRGHLESQAQSMRMPAGSPPRGGANLSALSPSDKIRYGLNQ